TSSESPYQAGLLKFKEVAEEASDGRIEVEVHAGTIGTEEPELVQKLVVGAADVVLVSPGFMTRTGIPEVDFFAWMYRFEDYEQWEKEDEVDICRECRETVNEKSDNASKMRDYQSASAKYYCGQKTLEEMSDLSAMTIRTKTSGGVCGWWEKAGALP